MIANAANPPLSIDTTWEPRQVGADQQPPPPTATPDGTPPPTPPPTPTGTPPPPPDLDSFLYLPLSMSSPTIVSLPSPAEERSCMRCRE
jgi:hypothetical protein